MKREYSGHIFESKATLNIKFYENPSSGSRFFSMKRNIQTDVQA